MRYHFVQNYFTKLQLNLYLQLNNFSQSNKPAGRFCSLPLSIADVALDALQAPLSAIEFVAMSAINLIGAAFYYEYTLKDALACIEFALKYTADIPVKVVMAPIKVAFQFFAILIDPETVRPIHYAYLTYDKVYFSVEEIDDSLCENQDINSA